MKLLASNTYQIEIENLVSQNCMTSLMLLYQPIMGHEAVSLYLTITAESRHNKTLSEFSRLLSITNMNIITLQNAIEKLIEFNLLDLYVDSDENRFVFHIRPCLSTENFFRHKVYSRLLLKYQGAENSDVTLSRLKKMYYDKKDMTLIKKDLQANIFNDWDEIRELEYDRLRRDRGIEPGQQSYSNSFNYEKFLSMATVINLPYEVRTFENMNRIGELACTYGISPERMLQHVGHSINLSKNILNINRLTYLVNRDNKTEEELNPDNPYKVSCVSFLQNKLGDLPVIDYHKRILNSLVENFKMKPEVVNVLVEYVMSRSSNGLTKNFAETTALIWKQHNVDSVEKAKQFIIENSNDKKSYSNKKYKPKQQQVLPAYKKGEKAEGDITQDISNTEAEELMEKLKRMR